MSCRSPFDQGTQALWPRTNVSRRRRWRRYILPSATIGTGILALALVFSTLNAAPPQPAKPVIVLSGSWAPYVDRDLPGGGPINILLADALEGIGYTPRTVFTGWAQAEQKIRRHEALGAFPFVGSIRRQDVFEVSDPIMDFEYVMFAGPGATDANIRNASDLRRFKVGSIKGYDYWPEINRAVERFTEFDTSMQAFEALAAGTIDLLPEGLAPGRAVLSNPDFSGDAGQIGQMKAKGNPLLGSTESLHFIMPRTEGSPALMARFNDSLAELKERDEFRSVVGSLESASPDLAVLRPAGSKGPVDIVDPATQKSFLTPSGTSVRVEQWPDPFRVGFSGELPRNLRVPVKILNGPLVGRVLQARVTDIELGELNP